jgi:hypothetical protein
MKVKGFLGDTMDYELKAFRDFTDLKDTSKIGEYTLKGRNWGTVQTFTAPSRIFTGD